MSAVHAVTTTLVILRDEVDWLRALPDGADAREAGERLARGVDYLIVQMAALGVACLEQHEQPRCGTCGASVRQARDEQIEQVRLDGGEASAAGTIASPQSAVNRPSPRV